MQANEPSYPLAVSPGLITFDDLKPGETYSGEFKVLNPSVDSSVVNYKISVAPLTYETWHYEPSFSDPDDYNQIVDWVTLGSTEGSLDPQVKDVVKFTIEVPEDAPAGGQYCAFLVALDNTPGEGDSGVSVSNKAQIAILLYAKVAGETREEGYVLENNVPAISLNQPIKTSSLVENTGNVHIPATYTLRVFPLFSNEEIYSNEEAPVVSTIFPDTVKYSEKTWDETPLLGLFRIEQDIDFGDRINRKESFCLVAPTWLVILALVFFASIIFALVERILRRRKDAQIS